MDSLDSRLADALAECSVDQKLEKVAALAQDWRDGRLPATPRTAMALTLGRPARPELVPHHQVPQRGPKSPEGRAALIHAIAHIEFSAINLALDHAARFPEMPAEYIGDWIGVADEEAYHFRLLRDHLRTYGFDYGSFPAHEGLQQMAERTTDDVLARMALVPRLLEARGLDATPPIQAKLRQAGDHEAVRLLDIILHDEIEHVGLGDKWFRTLCAARGIAPEASYREILERFRAPLPQAPINVKARLAAGFSAQELEQLKSKQ